MTLTRGNIMSLISKIHKGTKGKGMDDDVPAVIKLAQGGQPRSFVTRRIRDSSRCCKYAWGW